MSAAPPIIPSAPRLRVRLGPWPWILAVLLICFYGVLVTSVVAVVGMFRVSNTTRELRENLAEGLSGHFDKQVEMRIGGMGFGLARLAMAGLDVDPEVRAVVNGLHAVEVGVYRVDSKNAKRREVLQTAERKLLETGWERVVYVLDKENAVAIYAHQGKNEHEIRFYVMVVDGDDMVVASVQSDLEQVLEELMPYLSKTLRTMRF